MVRTCPFCKSHLSLNDKFFCSECGGTLPSELIGHDTPKNKPVELVDSIVFGKGSRISGTSKSSIPKTHLLKKIKLLPIIIVALTIPVLVLFLFDKAALRLNKVAFPSSTQNSSAIQSTPSKEAITVQNNNYVIRPTCSYLEGSLFNSDLIKLIPFSTDLYMETWDSENLFKDLVDSEIISDTKFISFYNENKNNLSGPFGFFVVRKSGEYSYGIVTKVQNSKGVDKVGGFVVVTTDTALLSEVKDASTSVSKNLSLNPVYASSKLLLPKTGKLTILPITKNGKGYMFQLLDKKLTSNMFSVVNGFLDSKLDYAVVL